MSFAHACQKVLAHRYAFAGVQSEEVFPAGPCILV